MLDYHTSMYLQVIWKNLNIKILPSLTRSKTLSPSTDTIISFDYIFFELASGIFPFTLSSVCLQALTYPEFLFSQISMDFVSSMQTEQKQESFLLSNANPFWKRFFFTGCVFLVPSIVLASYGIDLFTSSIPTYQKNLHKTRTC